MSSMRPELSQAKELLEKASSIAVVPAYDFCGDAFAASLALFSTLRKIGKKATFIAKDVPPQLAFLKDIGTYAKETVLVLNAKEKVFKQLRYEKSEQELKIYLTLQKGQLQPSDIKLTSAYGDFGADQDDVPELIFSLGFSDFEKLESVFSFSPKFLYDVQIVNIDNQIANERFGHVNLIDSTKPSLSEIVAEIIEEISENPIKDNAVTTCLLAGIITATQNFQHPRSGPGTLSLASKLMDQGADHQLIINRLYKTKPLKQMRLLGRALENLCFIPEKETSLTSLSNTDFQSTKTDSKDLAFVLEEIKASFPQIPSLLLLWESHGSGPLVKGIFMSKNPSLMNKVLNNFEGISRSNTALFVIREPEMERAKNQIMQIL